MSIVELIRKIAENEAKKNYTIELGVVTSVFPHSTPNDKENYECNVKIKGGEIELQHVQIATQVIGLACPPRVGDLVLVSFVNGDINLPVIIGRLYNDEDRPPVNDLEEIVFVPPYTKNAEKRRIYLEFPEGTMIKITDEDIMVKTGETKVIVHKDGDVVIESKADVVVKAKGNTKISSGGTLSLSASKIKVESEKELEVNAGADLKINTDANLKLTSSADMNMEASGRTTIKGATVNIN
ncbi:MAG: phage baseplate assembly protein V [Nitrososphaeria archaeon]|nr:phage baseplate assembly protein V [Nitrososphaeria archaeon]